MIFFISLLLCFQAKMCFEWLVTTTLSDRSQAVHNVMLEAAVEIVQVHGTGWAHGLSLMS
jgi:hypothetical protein